MEVIQTYKGDVAPSEQPFIITVFQDDATHVQQLTAVSMSELKRIELHLEKGLEALSEQNIEMRGAIEHLLRLHDEDSCNHKLTQQLAREIDLRRKLERAHYRQMAEIEKSLAEVLKS